MTDAETAALLDDPTNPAAPAAPEPAPWTCGAAWLASDLRWAYAETHLMLLEDFNLGSDAEWGALLASPYVLYNPVYWALYAATLPVVLTGKWVHALFGQGGPLTEDETRIEHSVRVQWVYPIDGFVFTALVLDVFRFAYYGAVGELAFARNKRGAELTYLSMATLLNAVYLGGNVLFLRAIARKRPNDVRLFIVSNYAFAVGLTVALVSSVQREGFFFHSHGKQRGVDAANFVLRASVVLFIVAAATIYAHLWSAYDDAAAAAARGAGKDGDAGHVGWRSWLYLAAIFVLVLGLLGVAFRLNDSYMWEALA